MAYQSREARDKAAPRIAIDGVRLDLLLRRVAAPLTAAVAGRDNLGEGNSVAIAYDTLKPQEGAQMRLEAVDRRTGAAVFFAMEADSNLDIGRGTTKPRYVFFAHMTKTEAGDEQTIVRTTTFGPRVAGNPDIYHKTTTVEVDGEIDPSRTVSTVVGLDAIVSMARAAGQFAVHAFRPE